MSLALQRRDWRSLGACLSADPDLFFPISTTGQSAPQIARAKAVCADCPVRPDCLAFALSHREMVGIWGGTTDEERRRSRRNETRRAASRRPAPDRRPRTRVG
jgi:WhiB family redox-sensing transcriptional regulator